MNEYALSDVKLTSSDEKSNPNDARMNSGKAWCPSQQSGQYLEVRFKAEYNNFGNFTYSATSNNNGI